MSEHEHPHHHAQSTEAEPSYSPLAVALPGAAREVELFVAAGGWNQSPQLFALVDTATLLDSRPELREQLDGSAPLTPVAQDSIPDGELDAALASIEWPETVVGCALAQEIVLLPPGAESTLPDADPGSSAAREAAAAHPDRREGRLVAAVLRDGPGSCVLRLRAVGCDSDPATADGEDVVASPDLAPNLLRALLGTLR